MPTVILLDTSVSMIRPFSCGDNGETVTLLQLAVHGINYFLDYLAANEKLEFVSLVTFSSMYEVLVNFTRDFESIKSKLSKVEETDEASIDQGLTGASKLVVAEWGPSVACNVVLFTDGSLGKFEFRSLKSPLPFAFPGKLYIISLSPPSSASLSFFNKLVESAGTPQGCVLTPEVNLPLQKAVTTMVNKLAESAYSTYVGQLKCGNMTAKIGLYPSPQPFTQVSIAETTTRTFSDSLQVCGFIDVATLASPMAVSRHLVTPIPVKQEPRLKIEVEGEEELDEGKNPSFCVLLHGALKVENVAALCQVAEDWFGVLYSWADSKKKSNLMLAVFEPGPNAVPWLGDLNYLSVLDEYSTLAPLNPSEPPAFPVRPVEKRSYSQSTVVWIRRAGLQADIQKILRHSRKLPEKTQQLYKELNRLRKAAVSFGFVELLDGLAAILERECANLPPSSNPDCALQLNHAAECLRRPSSRDPNAVIQPLKTRYQPDHD